MESEKQPEKIKYVLNGKTSYYTEKELWDYLKSYYNNNGLPMTDETFSEIKQKLVQYDGDPYGDWDQENREFFHSLETKGFMYLID